MLLVNIIIGLSKASTLQEGWFCEDIGHPCAVEIATEQIRKKPKDIQAHALYIVSSGRNNPFVLQMYQEQFEDEPNDKNALLYATAIYQMNRDSFCDDFVLDLLKTSSKELDVKYTKLRLQLMHQKTCDDKIKLKTVAKVIRLGTSYEMAQGFRIILLLKKEKCKLIQDEFDDFIQREPWSIDIFTRIFDSEESDCIELKERVLHKAIEIVDSDAYADIYAATKILKRAQETDLVVKATKKIDALTDGAFNIYDTFIEEILYDAENKPTHELAIREIQELEPLVPDSKRSLYNELLAERYYLLGDEDAYQRLMNVVLMDPNVDALTINNYYYSMAEKGKLLEEGLEQMNLILDSSILDAIPTTPNSHTPQWIQSVQFNKSIFYDTRGFIHYQMGNFELARRDFEKGLELVSRAPITLGYLAVTLHRLGEPKDVVYKMALMSLALSPSDIELEKELISIVRKYHASEYLWRSHSTENFLATFKKTYGLDMVQSHPFIGKKVPITEFDLIVGNSNSLVGHQEIIVVDIWATWCRPCIQNMPHLQQVANQFKDRGVVVVGLSVDENKKDVEDFFHTSSNISYTVGWLGEGGFDDFAVNTIPSIFVLDSNGIVQRYFYNYNIESNALEHFLEEMLNEQ